MSSWSAPGRSGPRPTHEWTARHVQRASADAFAPVATSSRDHDRPADDGRRDGQRLARPVASRLSAPDVPVVIVTTDAGARRLRVGRTRPERPDRGRGSRPIRGRATRPGDRLGRRRAADPVRGRATPDRRPRRAATCLTSCSSRSPRSWPAGIRMSAGSRSSRASPSSPATAPWSRRWSRCRRSGDHLFLRYRFREPETGKASEAA